MDNRKGADAELPIGAYSIEEDFARLHSIGRSTAYSEISAGRLTARKFRSRTLVTIEDAKEWRSSLPRLSPAAAAA
jgi:hypothetical protein